MVEYVRSYVDVCTGKVMADENTKEHFKGMLKLEADKLAPLALECKEKNIDFSTLCPELSKDYAEMLQALED